MSRVDSVEIAPEKGRQPCRVRFFRATPSSLPRFDRTGRQGRIAAMIQPGGSVKDPK